MKNENASVMKIVAKCSDMFSASFFDKNNACVGRYDGYVPDFMPGQHYGDYIELTIDLKTGQILNWKPPTQNQLSDLMQS